MKGTIYFEWVNNKQVCYCKYLNKCEIIDKIDSQYLLDNDVVNDYILTRSSINQYIIIKNVYKPKCINKYQLIYENDFNEKNPSYYYNLHFPFLRKGFNQCLVSNSFYIKGSRFIGKIKDNTLIITSEISNVNKINDDFIFMTKLYKQMDNNVTDIINAYNKLFLDKNENNIKDQLYLDTFYIDPKNSLDHDDAISIKIKDSNFILYIHIIDISHYINYKSNLDIEALKYNQTLYTNNIDKNVKDNHIYPENYSCDKLSLNVNKERNVVTTEIILDNMFNITSSKVYQSVIKVKNGYNYSTNKLNNYPFIKNFLKKWDYPTMNLNKFNYKIDKNVINVCNENPDNYDLICFNKKFIETLMILNNFIISKNVNNKNLNRHHPKPRNENPEIGIISKDYVDLIRVKEYTKAYYINSEGNHFGLNLDTYTHFTSPIRRFFDSLVHKSLFYNLSDEYINNINSVISYCNKRQLLNKNIFNYITNIHKWRFLIQNKDKLFNGIITKCMKSGINITILENCLDFRIHISKLSNEMLFYDEKFNKLENSSKTLKYEIGSTLLLKNPITDYITLFDISVV
jgi:ribonuclease R